MRPLSVFQLLGEYRWVDTCWNRIARGPERYKTRANASILYLSGPLAQVFESLEGFRMYYVQAQWASLHTDRESTDSLIQFTDNQYCRIGNNKK